eukprot:6200714-Pleurochrysis_carterae.AAC.4
MQLSSRLSTTARLMTHFLPSPPCPSVPLPFISSPLICASAICSVLCAHPVAASCRVPLVAGKVGLWLRTAYCGSLHAVIGFFDALRAEEHAQGKGRSGTHGCRSSDYCA